nr:microtubule-actin cross-linking factor 1 [Biomphalaria glabrata]
MFMVKDLGSNYTYTSKAYFERVVPTYEIDIITKETKMTAFKSDLYIFERNRDETLASHTIKKTKADSVQAAVGEDVVDGLPDVSFQSTLKNFAISGIVDPRTKQRLTISQALAKGVLNTDFGTYNNLEKGEIIPIIEAIARGYISVDYENHEQALNELETKVYTVSGVVNPKTGEIVSAKESINSGLFNLKTGKFTNPVTGEELSLCDAVRAGYILADSALQDEDNPLFSTSTSIVLEDAKYTVLAVTNLSTGQDVSLSQAIKDGIIDPIHGIYKNNWTGETMPIEEAFKRGYIKGKLFDPLQDKEDENVLCYQQLQVKKQILKAGQLVGGNLQSSDPNELLLNKLHEIENTANIMIQNPKTGKPISLEDSVLSGCINLADGSFETQNGEIISITEACALGLIEGQTLKEILRVYQQLSLANLVSSGQFDPYTGLVTDLKSGQTCTLQAAVESRVIDPTCTFFYDLAQNRVLSLSEAFDTGRLNKLSGEVIHPSTGEKLSVEQAELKKQINCDINPDEIVERLESLALLRRCMDTHQPAIRVPNVQHLVSVEEAVTMGILQVPKAAYVEEETVGQVQLGLAVQMERMDSQVALTILAALDKHSLEQEIGQGHFNPTTGMYMNPKTQKQFTIDEAHKSGLWNPYCVFLVDTETDSVTSLGYLADKGKYDPVSCHYLSDTMDASMTINEAIAKGLILPYIEPEKYVDTSCALKDLIDSGKVNPRTTDFMAANDLRLSLRDALANGFLTMGSKVKIDSETGAVVLASNEIVVQSLIQVKEQSDWLSDIANVLASQGLPSEKLDTLKRQTEDCLGLKEEISRNEPELRNVISQAEQIMQENVKTQDNQKVKDEVAQQFQKLKSSTTDLKVRFDMVNTETDNRSPKLSQMGRNLEELYYQMEELDQWLDSAIEKTQDFQLPSVEIDIQYTSMKELLEELKEREEDLSSIVKSADAFKENIQDVDKDVESFRKRLDILPTLREAGDAGVLDDELESIEAKFKDISKECAKQMERIGTLAKLSKIVNEHKERLSQAYPVIQENLNKLIEDEDFGLDPHRAAIDRDNLRNIKSDLIGQERKLKDLPAAGDRLVSGLLDSERNEEAEEVQAMLEFLREEHDRLQEDISEQEQQLDAAAAEQHNVLGRLEGIEMSLRECEEQVASQRDISLDKEKLSQQIQEQRLVNAKIASNRSLLERLCLDVEGNNEAEQKLKNLMELAEALESRAEERTQELEELLTNIVEYESKAVDLDSWLSESIKTLKPKSGAPKPTKTKVEGLYEGKAEKDGEMETLRQMCGHLSEANGVKDKYALKELLADVETKWNDLTELLVQQVSLEALSEIDGMLKYLDKAENEINTAESISIDPETLSIQLREHKIFDTDLKGKRNAVKDIIDKCTHMLRETANSQSDEIKFRLDTITQQADLVCQLSADRLHQLEAALPLATHYGENQTEVCAWLDEMEAELVAQCEPGLNLEQVKKQHDNLKANQQIIEDRKLFIDDLNSTGLELMDICAEQDAVDIQNRLLEGLKSKAHTKSRDLTDAKRKLTQEAGDTLDHLKDELDGLHQTVTNADPILSSPEKLRNEIDENKAVLEDLEHQKQALAKAEDVAKNPKAYGVEDLTDAEELQHKYKEICDMSKDIRLMAEARDKNLTTALKLSERFYDMSVDVMSGLRDPLEYTAV